MIPLPDPVLARFIRQAKVQVLWLNSELSRLSLSSENRESDERAIRAAKLELATIIRTAVLINRAEATGLSQSKEGTTGCSVMPLNKHQLPESAPIAQRCMLAHELNNDLAIIIGECDLLYSIIIGDAAASARLRAIKAVARRMADRISTRACPVGETSATES